MTPHFAAQFGDGTAFASTTPPNEHVAKALEYVANDAFVYGALPLWLKETYSVALAAVRTCAFSYLVAMEYFPLDAPLVIAAVSCDGCLLKHVPERFKSDRDVVLAAVRNDGMALQYAGPALSIDLEIAYEAVAGDARALHLASVCAIMAKADTYTADLSRIVLCIAATVSEGGEENPRLEHCVACAEKAVAVLPSSSKGCVETIALLDLLQRALVRACNTYDGVRCGERAQALSELLLHPDGVLVQHWIANPPL